MAERRGRLAPELVEGFLKAVDLLAPMLDAQPSGTEVLRLARRRGLTAHDALYLELALRRGAALVTLDRAPPTRRGPSGVALLGGASEA